MLRHGLAVFAVVVLATSCTDSNAERVEPVLAPTEDAGLPRPDGDLWYRVTGTGSGTPVILLHGGPGFSSFYLKSLEALGDDRPVIRYDQLGSGRSDTLADTASFTVERFVEELEALRAHLGLERFHLYGHSWGTMLATEYYQAHPDRVVSLVLGSAALDARAWERHTRDLLQTLPDSMVEAVETREAERNYTAPDYQAAMEEFYARYVWRRPVIADLDSMMATFNTSMYEYMWGPSEFTVTGTLKEFDAKPMLGTITVPVLYTVGEFDEAGPENIETFARLTPGARVVVIPEAGHITAWDNREADLEAVRVFLREADGGS